MTIDQLKERLTAHSLISLGVARGEDAALPDGVQAVALLGVDREGWPLFKASPEAQDGQPDPLDRWSLRVISALAEEMDVTAYFPFGGPPYQPFLRWAAATGEIWPSALGMSIHAEQGLWMSFRGALGFAALEGQKPSRQSRPCDSCAEKPCLSACPVSAFSADIYDVPACVGHLSAQEGENCLKGGCLARRACPIGTDWTPAPSRAYFHMSAFKRARTDG